jgi:hypothetical protein
VQCARRKEYGKEVTTYLHPSNVEVINVWSCNSTLLHKFMTLNRDNFSLVTKAAPLLGKKKKGERSGRRKNLETT